MRQQNAKFSKRLVASSKGILVSKQSLNNNLCVQHIDTFVTTMVLVAIEPSTMDHMMIQKTKSRKNPVEVFNGSSSKLSKLPGLIEYVSAALDQSDFIIILGDGEPIEMSPAQFEVIRSVYRTPRKEIKIAVRRLCLYFLMRYDDFNIQETALTDSLSGLRVRLAPEQDII